jgi:hypothetical protein
MTQEELRHLITQVYFYCNNNDAQGIYPTEEIDLLEFTQKLLAVIQAQKVANLPQHSNS